MTLVSVVFSRDDPGASATLFQEGGG